MSWYPGAQRLELQPESRDQPAIKPTQFIMHSIAAPWDEQRIYEYWRDSTNLESTFGLDFDGSLGQFLSTTTDADANYHANRRPDGTGAVSVETASNLEHNDPWTEEQVIALVNLGVWLHREHGIPLRVCRTWDDPGFGYHRLFPEWSKGSTACPGDARVEQFHSRVFPGIVAVASGQPLNPSKGFTVDDEARDWFGKINAEIWDNKNKLGQLQAKVDELSAKVGGASTEDVKAAVREELAAGTVKVDVSIHGATG